MAVGLNMKPPGDTFTPGEFLHVTGAPRSFVGESHDLARVASAQLYFCFAVSRPVSAFVFPRFCCFLQLCFMSSWISFIA